MWCESVPGEEGHLLVLCVLTDTEARYLNRIKPQVTPKKRVPCCWVVCRCRGLCAVPTHKLPT